MCVNLDYINTSRPSRVNICLIHFITHGNFMFLKNLMKQNRKQTNKQNGKMKKKEKEKRGRGGVRGRRRYVKKEREGHGHTKNKYIYETHLFFVFVFCLKKIKGTEQRKRKMNILLTANMEIYRIPQFKQTQSKSSHWQKRRQNRHFQ